MNKQSSYRVVDVLTTDTCPVKLVPSLEMWKGNVYHQKCVTIYHHTYVDVREYVIYEVVVMCNHMAR